MVAPAKQPTLNYTIIEYIFYPTINIAELSLTAPVNAIALITLFVGTVFPSAAGSLRLGFMLLLRGLWA